jgi:hypothetical protein
LKEEKEKKEKINIHKKVLTEEDRLKEGREKKDNMYI